MCNIFFTKFTNICSSVIYDYIHVKSIFVLFALCQKTIYNQPNYDCIIANPQCGDVRGEMQQSVPIACAIQQRNIKGIYVIPHNVIY